MSEPIPDSAGHDDQSPSLAERALDLFVFVPAGAVVSVIQDVPGMAARGRTVIEQELRNARLVGQLAVGEGQRRLRQGVERLTGPGDRAGGAAATAAGETAGEEALAIEVTEELAEELAEEFVEELAEELAEEELASAAAMAAQAQVTADLVIPGYDTLSASQVVRRLDGLGPEELAAVFRHEAASRGRRTILHRAQQLLAAAGRQPPSGT